MEPITISLLITGGLGGLGIIGKKMYNLRKQREQVDDMATIFQTSPELSEIVLPLSVSTHRTP
jgi:hypothetical protein